MIKRPRQKAPKPGLSLRDPVRFVLLFLVATSLPFSQRSQAATHVVIWDTIASATERFDFATRKDWRAVPIDLLSLEADPPKASSDPGYYGRAYSFIGDAVVENTKLIAAFWSAQGRVVIQTKPDATFGGHGTGRKVLEIVPHGLNPSEAVIDHCEIVRHGGDEAVLEIFFGGRSATNASVVFAFGRNEIIEIKPGKNPKAFSLLGDVEYGVIPSLVGDDLIFNPADYAAASTLSVPSENWLVGLLKGEDSMLVLSWPKGRQQLNLRTSKEEQGRRLIQAIDFTHDAQSFYLAILGAPGIWHREELKPAYLEKEVVSEWRRPFPAKWITQLPEAGVKTRFNFRESKGQIWRGVPGSYSYPVWMTEDRASFFLSKKIPPKGESIVYFLEGQDTPGLVLTPVDVLKSTLGRSLSEPILDVAGRKLRTHHRRGGDGVRRACTCGCTEAIQAIFEAGEEVTRKATIKEQLDDMIFFVEHHVERIEEYQRFARDLMQFLEAKESSTPELRPYLESLEQIVGQIPQEYNVQKENMKSLQHAGELSRRTMALTERKDAGNLKVYMELSKEWRAMGGAQDYVLAQCHSITRKLHQEAGFAGVTQPKSIDLAVEIRTRARQCLRNPDGYEIWADY